MSFFKTHESFLKEVSDKYGDEYKILDTYQNNKINLRVQHNCGFQYYCRPDSILRDDRGLCPRCQKKLHRDNNENEFKNYLLELTNNEYQLKSRYQSDKKPVTLKHLLCGHTFKTTPNSFKKGTRCEYCRKESVISASKERLKSFIADDFEILKYEGSGALTTLKCNTCNKEFQHYPGSIYKGSGCPHCNKPASRSRGEMEVYDFVKAFYPNARNNVRFKNSSGNILELDIYIEELKLGIEYDGLYWHSDQLKGGDAMIEKNIFFEEFGIKVVHIFEDEWKNRNKATVSYLKYVLKVSDQEKISARKCTFRFINKEESDIFLSENSLVINDSSNIQLGAFYNKHLVGVMTFRDSGNGNYYLDTYCPSMMIYGGFQKMLKMFKDFYDPKKITGEINLRFSDADDNILAKNGFTKIGLKDPKFFYCRGNRRFSAKAFKKNDIKRQFPEIFNEALTAYDMMELTPYFRVYDCGRAIYEMK